MTARKPRTEAAFCDTCTARIIWATTEAGAKQALDRQPNPLGNVIAYQDATGSWHARSTASGAQPRHPLEKTYMPHPATCTGRRPQADDPPYEEEEHV
jgi:hypothetical protein